MAIPFSADEDSRLAALFAEGLSDSQIAAKLRAEGFPKRSPNSVIGRRHRKGIVDAARARQVTPLPKVERRAPPKAVAKRGATGEVKRLATRARDLGMTNLAAEMELASDCLAPTPASLPAPLPDLRRGIPFLGAPNEACRFPLWADDARPTVAAMRICGASVRPGRPYCPCCCALAYVLVDPRRERAQKAAQDERTARRRTQAWSAA